MSVITQNNPMDYTVDGWEEYIKDTKYLLLKNMGLVVHNIRTMPKFRTKSGSLDEKALGRIEL